MFGENCTVKDPWSIGNEECDRGENDVESCNYDGGDCGPPNKEDYPECQAVDFELLGNGQCDGGIYNTKECNFDRGDCEEWNKLRSEGRYEYCLAPEPHRIGDGKCEKDHAYDNLFCGWDGGDCKNKTFEERFPNCAFLIAAIFLIQRTLRDSVPMNLYSNYMKNNATMSQGDGGIGV